MTRPSISLFLPAWNEEDYVERAVARAVTVLERLTDDFEVLVINDASTDRTRELAEAIAARDPRVRCISHEVNQKLGGAMKTCFSSSTKDIVVYSDMDLPFDLNEIVQACLHQVVLASGPGHREPTTSWPRARQFVKMTE